MVTRVSAFSAFVHLPAYLNVAAYERDHAAGIEPDASPYGFHHAREFGVDVRFSSLAGSEGSIVQRKMRRLFGFDIVNSFRNRKGMAAADVIWTMLEEEALGAALLMKLRLLPRRPIVASTVWMVNNWQRTSGRRQRFYRWLLREVSLLLVQSQACIATMQSIVGADKVRLLHFGISAGTFDGGGQDCRECGWQSPAPG